MTAAQLTRNILNKQSFLCVGLDPDPAKIPTHLQSEPDPVFAFNKAIIDATIDLAVAYKPNIAFFESMGEPGMRALRKTIGYLNEKHPDQFTIADAKRGDIGNTSRAYANAFFKTLAFDSVTVAPYMGRDSVEPFLEFEDKFAILLALTSNPGAFDFQTIEQQGEALYEKVIRTALSYENANRLMFVIGATKAEYLQKVRAIAPEHFLLVPGVGAQGGSLSEVCRYGLSRNVGLLVNSSRAILYASSGEDFAQKAREAARDMQQQMAAELAKV